MLPVTHGIVDSKSAGNLLDISMVSTNLGDTVSFLIQGDQFDTYTVDWGDGVLVNYVDPNGFNFVISDVSVGTNNINIFSNGNPTRFQVTTNTITSINLTAINTLISFRELVRNISNLISFSSVSTVNISDFFNAWDGCSNLTNFPNLNYSSMTTMQQAFRGCSALTSISINSPISPLAPSNMTGAFSGCINLLNVMLGDTSKVTNFNSLFSGCTSLICFNQIDTLISVDTGSMFLNTPALTNPNAAEQTAILAGSNYVNANPCP